MSADCKDFMGVYIRNGKRPHEETHGGALSLPGGNFAGTGTLESDDCLGRSAIEHGKGIDTLTPEENP